jgi:hypothetical protein
VGKVFCFFFSKKKSFLPLLSSQPRCDCTAFNAFVLSSDGPLYAMCHRPTAVLDGVRCWEIAHPAGQVQAQLPDVSSAAAPGCRPVQEL